MKNIVISLSVIVMLIASAMQVSYAQRRVDNSEQSSQSFDKFERKAAQKASKAKQSTRNEKIEKSSTAFEAQPSMQVYSAQAVKQAPVQSVKNSKGIKNAPVSSVTTVNSSSPKAAYNTLLQRQVIVQEQIEMLSAELNGLRGGKAKKLVKKIDLLQQEKKQIAQQISMYPRSITDPEYAQQLEEQETQKFKQQLNAETAALIAKNDPFYGKMSEDPELQQAYREYIQTFAPSKYSQDQTMEYSSDQVVFRVMFAISKKPLSQKTLASMSPVLEQKLPTGGAAYYTGNFKTKAEAQAACNKILANGVYRDAFVVAMVGGKRVPLQ